MSLLYVTGADLDAHGAVTDPAYTVGPKRRRTAAFTLADAGIR
jgi:hypothetical protein